MELSQVKVKNEAKERGEGEGGEEAAMKDDKSFQSQMMLDVFKSRGKHKSCFCFSSLASHPDHPVLTWWTSLFRTSLHFHD